jgi:hypothetical protein
MEHAGRLLGKLNRTRQVMTNEELTRAAWPRAVGPKIASYTEVAALVRNCLVIEVQDMVWQRQLTTLRQQILKNLANLIGPGLVTEIELRPMTPKREPKRAELPRRSAALADEADAIVDPVLRRVYKDSRKKASA